MGIGRIISREATRRFFKNICKGAKSGEISFSPWKLRKQQPFLLKFKKSMGGILFPNGHDPNLNPNSSFNPNTDLMVTLTLKLNPKTYPLNPTCKPNSKT